MPRTACRVVCGFEEAMTIFWPTRALVRVDLPALGRPTKQAKPLCTAPSRLCVESSGFPSELDHRQNRAVAIGPPDRHTVTGQIAENLEVLGTWPLLAQQRHGLDAAGTG